MKVFIEDFELALCWQKTGHLPEPYRGLLTVYFSHDFARALVEAKICFEREKEPEVKAVLVHLICAICENLYDLSEKSIWMKKWHSFSGGPAEAFSKVASKYHLAVNCYFESYYHEAMAKFQDLTSESTPLRLKALAHYHLGLIYQTKNLELRSRKEYQLGLEIAESIKHQSLIKRISDQLIELDAVSSTTFLNADLTSLILTNQVAKARSAYLAKRRFEKTKNLARDRNAYHAVLPSLMWLQKRSATAITKILRLIEDPVIRLQALDLLKSVGGLTSQTNQIYIELQHELGVNLRASAPATNNFLGKNLDLMESEDLSLFASLLKEKSKITKEEICQKVWGYEYDPVLHDSKIYKMIHRFRNYFGKKDILVNRYGYYEINPRYRAG